MLIMHMNMTDTSIIFSKYRPVLQPIGCHLQLMVLPNQYSSLLLK